MCGGVERTVSGKQRRRDTNTAMVRLRLIKTHFNTQHIHLQDLQILVTDGFWFYCSKIFSVHFPALKLGGEFDRKEDNLLKYQIGPDP